MRWTPILRDLGTFVHLPAMLSIPSVCVCVAFGEWRLLPGFAIMAVISLAVGQYLARRPVGDRPSQSLTASMVTVGASWLAIGLLTCIPFLYWGMFERGNGSAAFTNFWSSLFEAMSGITSTGLTMAEDASVLPRAIQWWRSLLEWVGGVGVVVLALAIIRPAESGKVLLTAEAREERIGTTFRATGRRIWWLFGALTVFSILLFRALGMPWWEALNHGMTGIATGGFTVTANSFADYGTRILLAAILIMALGAVSFRTYANVFIERNFRSLVRDVPTLVLVGFLAAGILLLVSIDHLKGTDRGVVAVAFQWVSALGTCGFQTTEFSGWLGAPLLLLTVAMLVGGAAGSTTGGIKIDRAILAVLGPIWHMRRRLSTRKGVQYYVIDGVKVAETDALQRYRGAAALVSLFVTVIVVGTFVLMLTIGPGYTPQEILFEVTSAMSNVGLSTGLTGPTLPWIAKLTLIIVMWMGRLEITAVLVLIGYPILLARDKRSQKDA